MGEWVDVFRVEEVVVAFRRAESSSVAQLFDPLITCYNHVDEEVVERGTTSEER